MFSQTTQGLLDASLFLVDLRFILMQVSLQIELQEPWTLATADSVQASPRLLKSFQRFNTSVPFVLGRVSACHLRRRGFSVDLPNLLVERAGLPVDTARE